MNILICDSNALSAMELDWMLNDHGHSVDGPATSVGKCLERCSEHRPDLVLVGLNPMEGDAGLSLVEALTTQGIASIILSAEADRVPASCSAKAVGEQRATDRVCGTERPWNALQAMTDWRAR